MTLFHGSYIKVEHPNLALSRKSLDFGAGYYTTVNKEQAIAFAQKVKTRRKHQEQIVNIYNFDIEAASKKLNIIEFASPDKFWLEYVHHNRHGTYEGKQYDLAVGPVANDDVYATLIIYEQGILNIEQTIEALKVKKLYNQYVFKTDKALTYLKYTDSFDARGMSHDS